MIISSRFDQHQHDPLPRHPTKVLVMAATVIITTPPLQLYHPSRFDGTERAGNIITKKAASSSSHKVQPLLQPLSLALSLMRPPGGLTLRA